MPLSPGFLGMLLNPANAQYRAVDPLQDVSKNLNAARQRQGMDEERDLKEREFKWRGEEATADNARADRQVDLQAKGFGFEQQKHSDAQAGAARKAEYEASDDLMESLVSREPGRIRIAAAKAKRHGIEVPGLEELLQQLEAGGQAAPPTVTGTAPPGTEAPPQGEAQTPQQQKPVPGAGGLWASPEEAKARNKLWAQQRLNVPDGSPTNARSWKGVALDAEGDRTNSPGEAYKLGYAMALSAGKSEPEAHQAGAQAYASAEARLTTQQRDLPQGPSAEGLVRAIETQTGRGMPPPQGPPPGPPAKFLTQELENRGDIPLRMSPMAPPQAPLPQAPPAGPRPAPMPQGPPAPMAGPAAPMPQGPPSPMAGQPVPMPPGPPAPMGGQPKELPEGPPGPQPLGLTGPAGMVNSAPAPLQILDRHGNVVGQFNMLAAEARIRGRLNEAFAPLEQHAGNDPERKRAAALAKDTATSLAVQGTVSVKDAIERGNALYDKAVANSTAARVARGGRDDAPADPGGGGSIASIFGSEGLPTEKRWIYTMAAQERHKLAGLKKTKDLGDHLKTLGTLQVSAAQNTGVGDLGAVRQMVLLTDQRISDADLRLALESGGQFNVLHAKLKSWVDGGKLPEGYMDQVRAYVGAQKSGLMRLQADLVEEARNMVLNDPVTSQLSPEDQEIFIRAAVGTVSGKQPKPKAKTGGSTSATRAQGQAFLEEANK